jgi:hypothetical protein
MGRPRQLVRPFPEQLPLLDGIAAHPEAPEYWWI